MCLFSEEERSHFSKATLFKMLEKTSQRREHTLLFFGKKTEHMAFNYSKKATLEAEVSNVS